MFLLKRSQFGAMIYMWWKDPRCSLQLPGPEWVRLQLIDGGRKWKGMPPHFEGALKSHTPLLLKHVFYFHKFQFMIYFFHASCF